MSTRGSRLRAAAPPFTVLLSRTETKGTGVAEPQWVVNYEIDIAHVHSLLHNYTSVSFFTRMSGSLSPPLSPGTQIAAVGRRSA